MHLNMNRQPFAIVNHFSELRIMNRCASCRLLLYGVVGWFPRYFVSIANTQANAFLGPLNIEASCQQFGGNDLALNLFPKELNSQCLRLNHFKRL